MTEEKLLTIREVAAILGISEKEVIKLSDEGSIPAYKIGGIYLRFKRQQVEEIKKKLRLLSHKEINDKEYSLKDKVSDFLYFNDFYLLSGVIVILILYIILRG